MDQLLINVQGAWYFHTLKTTTVYKSAIMSNFNMEINGASRGCEVNCIY